MRLSANENVPGNLVAALRSAGHDVFWVRTEMRGSTDEQVLAHAVADKRVLLTFDKDFGELAFRSGLTATSGIILLRMPIPDPAVVASRIVALLDSRSDWVGHFVVVTTDQVRMRPLPPAS